MPPDDRVLIGVISRPRDLVAAREGGWYRIPVLRAPRAIDAAWLGFFLSRRFGRQNGGIHYYAPVRGHELCRRRDLLPDEAGHPRADMLYFRMALGPLCTRIPPILNPTRRTISFILTTWDRFCAAQVIADLYSTDPRFVERL